MKNILITLTLLVFISCNNAPPKCWPCETNDKLDKIITLLHRDTVYIHDTIYIGDAGITDSKDGIGKRAVK